MATKEDGSQLRKEPVFKDLQADDQDMAPQEIESLCMNCSENVSSTTQRS
jgi:hypothetical protein